MPDTPFERAAEFIDGIAELPMISRAAQDAMLLTQSPNATFPLVGRAVEGDPVLAAKVLKAANSAFYAAAQPATTITSAISCLGLGEVRALIGSAAVMGEFQQAGGVLDLEAFWQHSLATALACHALARFGGDQPGGLLGDSPYYLCGLTHHLGLLVEAIHQPASLKQALDLAAERQWPLQRAETEVFGFGHSECGAVLLLRWSSPQMMIDAALYHLDPDACPGDKRAAQVVHLAGWLCQKAGLGAYEGELPPYSQQAFKDLGWTEKDLPGLQQRVKHALDKGKQLYSSLS